MAAEDTASQRTAIELARWQGQQDTRMEDAERRLDTINGHIEDQTKVLSQLVGAVKTWAIVTPLLVGMVVALVNTVLN